MHANQCFILGPNVVSGHTASHSWSRKAYWFPCACVYIQLRDSSSQVTGHTTCFNKVLLYPPLINSRYWTFVLDVFLFFFTHTHSPTHSWTYPMSVNHCPCDAGRKEPSVALMRTSRWIGVPDSQDFHGALCHWRKPMLPMFSIDYNADDLTLVLIYLVQNTINLHAHLKKFPWHIAFLFYIKIKTSCSGVARVGFFGGDFEGISFSLAVFVLLLTVYW